MRKKKHSILVSLITIITLIVMIMVGYFVEKTKTVNTDEVTKQSDSYKMEENTQVNLASNTSTGPMAYRAWLDVDTGYGYQYVGGNYYLKAGDQITIGVSFSEPVFRHDGTQLMDGEKDKNNHIGICFTKDGNNQQEYWADFLRNSDTAEPGGPPVREYCVYQFIIPENDSFFDGSVYISTREVSIPAQMVWSSSQQGNEQAQLPLTIGGAFWNDPTHTNTADTKIYVDAVKPTVESATVNISGYTEKNGHYYLEQGKSTIIISVTFSETASKVDTNKGIAIVFQKDGTNTRHSATATYHR